MPVIYLPSIHKPGDLAAQHDPVAAFAELWMAAIGDRATEMICDGRLMHCAQDHVIYLDGRTGTELEQNMHIGRNGSTPNQRARDAGYRLPGWWPVAGNQVECCVRSGDSAADALGYLLASPAHRPLMLREDWYAGHVVWGIGHQGADWVIIAAPVEAGP